KVARFLGAPRHEEIVFTKGTTEAINLVASAWGRANLSAGDAIGVTEMALLESLPLHHGGGEMIDEVWVDRSTYRKPPQKFEAGTPPIAGAIGLGVAVNFLSGIGMERIHEHEKRLAAA